MKKSLLATVIGAALATTLPTDASAATYQATSNITNIQLWLGQIEMMTDEAPGYFNNLQIGGAATDDDEDGYIDRANLTFTGLIGFTINALPVQLVFNLSSGNYTPGSGITFSSGYIQPETLTTSGWVPYGVLDASVTNIGFLANQPGYLVSAFPDRTTAGITRNALPGLWDGEIGGAGFNRAASVLTIWGQTIAFYLEGDIEAGALLGPPEVPIPGAVWLFGSALTGLAGLRRRRA